MELEVAKELGDCLFFGLFLGSIMFGLALGSGIYRGLDRIARSMVRSAKIQSNAKVAEHAGKHIWYEGTDTHNDA